MDQQWSLYSGRDLKKDMITDMSKFHILIFLLIQQYTSIYVIIVARFELNGVLKFWEILIV